MRYVVAIALSIGLAALAASQVTVFVLQPIGALPDGATIVIWRREGTRFIDSADAMCLRVQDGVSLLCRAMVLGGIGKGGDPLIRLPYSEMLYLYTTGGRTFDR